MKLSDKALRLIGLTVLESMDRKKIQDNTEQPRNDSPAGGYGRPRLTLKARLKTAKATVIPLRIKKPES